MRTQEAIDLLRETIPEVAKREELVGLIADLILGKKKVKDVGDPLDLDYKKMLYDISLIERRNMVLEAVAEVAKAVVTKMILPV